MKKSDSNHKQIVRALREARLDVPGADACRSWNPGITKQPVLRGLKTLAPGGGGLRKEGTPSVSDSFRDVPVPDGVLKVAEGVPEAWAKALWNDVIAGKIVPRGYMRHSTRAPRFPEAKRLGSKVLTVELPAALGTGEAVVKLYRPRWEHGPLRRWRRRRAECEGRGFAVFRASEIPTVRLLLYGEARRWGLLKFGMVVSERVQAMNIVKAYRKAADPALLESTIDALAAIHRAGLAHGDPRMRNFLATRPRPLILDLSSWDRLKSRSQKKDLVRALASVLLLTGDIELVASLLLRYENEMSTLPAKKKRLLREIERFSRRKKRP